MRFTTFLGCFLAATISVASPIPTADTFYSPIPNYPPGNGFCLSDTQASFLADTFRSVLANTNRKAANATAQVLLADDYTEQSDSIDLLAGIPIGQPTFKNKQAFINGALSNPPLDFSTIKVVHDCTNIVWQWKLTGLGLNKYPVKGFNSFVVKPLTGVIQSNSLEFNSIAWGVDTGYTVTPPPGGAPI